MFGRSSKQGRLLPHDKVCGMCGKDCTAAPLLQVNRSLPPFPCGGTGASHATYSRLCTNSGRMSEYGARLAKILQILAAAFAERSCQLWGHIRDYKPGRAAPGEPPGRERKLPSPKLPEAPGTFLQGRSGPMESDPDEAIIPIPDDSVQVPILGEDLPLCYYSALESPSIEKHEDLSDLIAHSFWPVPAVRWARMSISSRESGSSVVNGAASLTCPKALCQSRGHPCALLACHSG